MRHILAKGNVPMEAELPLSGNATKPLSAVPLQQLQSYVADAIAGIAAVALPGFLYGLTIANNNGDLTNDIDVAAGSAAAADGTLMRLTSGLTKRLDAAWAVGSGVGGLMSAAGLVDTTYHCHLIRRPDTGVVELGFDVSATAPTLPASYTQFRRVGSILREAGAIVRFTQNGDDFLLYDTIQSVNDTNPGGGQVTRVVDTPLGIQTDARLFVSLANTANAGVSHVYLSSLDKDNEVPNSSRSQAGNAANAAGRSTNAGAGPFLVRTDLSAQIRSRLSYSDANVTMVITTEGWIDTRGRLGP